MSCIFCNKKIENKMKKYQCFLPNEYKFFAYIDKCEEHNCNEELDVDILDNYNILINIYIYISKTRMDTFKSKEFPSISINIFKDDSDIQINWLEYIFVPKEYRRKKIASFLVYTVSNFCKDEFGISDIQLLDQSKCDIYYNMNFKKYTQYTDTEWILKCDITDISKNFTNINI